MGLRRKSKENVRIWSSWQYQLLKEAASKANKIRPISEITRMRILEAIDRRRKAGTLTQTVESNKKRSIAHKGKVGTKCTDETRKKHMAARIGKNRPNLR